jgi:hypothetical protein
VSSAGTEAERATRAHEEASPLAAGRPQALNEDLSDCAEACPSAKQPVFAVAIGPQWGRAVGSREGTRIGIKRPGASGRSALQDPRQGSLTFDTRMRNDIPYPLRPSLTSPDERGG